MKDHKFSNIYLQISFGYAFKPQQPNEKNKTLNKINNWILTVSSKTFVHEETFGITFGRILDLISEVLSSWNSGFKLSSRKE